MCCVVHSGIEGQINRESGVPLCRGPLIGHIDRGDPSLLSLTGWGSVGEDAVVQLRLVDGVLRGTGRG